MKMYCVYVVCVRKTVKEVGHLNQYSFWHCAYDTEDKITQMYEKKNVIVLYNKYYYYYYYYIL